VIVLLADVHSINRAPGAVRTAAWGAGLAANHRRPSAEPPDRVVLKDTGVVRTRRDDAATVEQVIAGIPGKPRYYVLDSGKLERLLRKGPSRS
jgi:hypothetical protein